jgi:hypothetical protein
VRAARWQQENAEHLAQIHSDRIVSRPATGRYGGRGQGARGQDLACVSGTLAGRAALRAIVGGTQSWLADATRDLPIFEDRDHPSRLGMMTSFIRGNRASSSIGYSWRFADAIAVTDFWSGTTTIS